MRPHNNDDIRWVEIFYLAAVVVHETSPEEPVDDGLMTIDEFMDYMRKRLSE